jgi:DNA-binding CsgD family transcriptional regulator
MPNPEITELSERELDILKLVATGASNKEIAQKLFISSNTVKVHLRNIFSKIGVNSRTEAAMYAVHNRMVAGAPTQVLTDDSGDIETITNPADTQSEVFPLSVEVVRPSTNRLSRWSAYILIIGLLGLIFLGWRLSPGLIQSTSPTSSPRPPQPTLTPIPHWNSQAVLPSARSDPALVAYGNQIYAIGGLNSQGVYAGVDRFDPQTNTWTSLAPKPLPVFNAHAAVINGLIYIPGGRLSIDNIAPTAIMEIFDTDTGEWQTGASLPVPLSAYGLVAYDGGLYVFGGWDGKNYRNNVYSYDPTTNAWQERTSMPTARAFCGAAEAGGKIYVIGGINDNQSVDVNEIYSPSRDNKKNNPWDTGFSIPETRSALQAATIADTIYVFGGEIQHSNRVGLIYFPQTNVWQSLEASPHPLGEDFSMTAIGTNLFFVGGKFDAAFSDQNLTYQAIITLSIPIIIK